MSHPLIRLLIATLIGVVLCGSTQAQTAVATKDLTKLEQDVGRDCSNLPEIPGLSEKDAMPNFCKCVTGRASALAQSPQFGGIDFNSPANKQAEERLGRMATSYCLQNLLIESAAKEAATRCQAGDTEFPLPASLPPAARYKQCTCIADHIAHSQKVESASEYIPVEEIKRNVATARSNGIAACSKD